MLTDHLDTEFSPLSFLMDIMELIGVVFGDMLLNQSLKELQKEKPLKDNENFIQVYYYIKIKLNLVYFLTHNLIMSSNKKFNYRIYKNFILKAILFYLIII
jgi:hypothetical protein